MITYEDGCVVCPKEMECLGDSCPYKNNPTLICDTCHKEVEELYEVEFDNDQRCLGCLLEVVGAEKVKI